MCIFRSLRRFAGTSLVLLSIAQVSADEAPQARLKVQGKVTGYSTLERDGWADVAIVFPTLSEEQILSFDFTSMLSPNEEMKAGPITTEVPGNLHVPEQKERYGIIPVTLRKDNFTLLMEPGLQQELFVMSLRAPFSDAANLARKKAPAPDVLKLVKFGQLGFASARDWTELRNSELKLNRDRPKSTTINWSRNAATDNEMDVVINIEETPAGKWLVSDLNTTPGAATTVKSTGFTGMAKLMLARATFKNDRKELDFMRAWFPTHTRASRINASSVPNVIRDAKWAENNVFTWSPGEKKGWVTIFREEILPASESPEVDPSLVYFPDLSRLVDFSRPRVSAGWVRVEEGRIALDASMIQKKTRLVFVFLGGDELADGPALAGASELQVREVTP